MIVRKWLAIFFGFFVISNSYANNEISGKWKVIDDRSGVVRSIIQIYKNTNETYSGRVLKIYPELGKSKPYNQTCSKCKGELKDQPIVGMEILFGFKKNSKNEDEYIDGRIIDPDAGEVYKCKMKISKNSRRLTLIGYIAISQLGRKQTWIRVD